jgi:hypothetical protein
VKSLCEFAWVPRSVYGYRASSIARAIRLLLAAENVETDRQVAEAGLAMLDAGGDFADGVIAYEGKWLGAETFVSFDKKAVEMLSSAGVSARAWTRHSGSWLLPLYIDVYVAPVPRVQRFAHITWNIDRYVVLPPGNQGIRDVQPWPRGRPSRL